MTFEEYQIQLARTFHEVVAKAIHAEDFLTDCIEELLAPAREHHLEWGFSCSADCFSRAVPKSDRLTLHAWSEAIMSMDCWNLKVRCRPLVYGGNHVHIEVSGIDGNPLPISDTGYRSYFVPLPAFRGNKTVRDFVADQFPRSAQLTLF